MKLRNVAVTNLPVIPAENPLTGVITTNYGNVGIGTTNPNDGKVEVKGGTVCVDTNSDDSATSCITAESDIRLKKNVTRITSALEKIQKINGVTFDWRWDEYGQIQRFEAKPHGMGVIAQEVEDVFPEAMNEEIGSFKSVDKEALVAPLIEAVKELNLEVKELAKENKQLKDESLRLKNKLNNLESRIVALKGE